MQRAVITLLINRIGMFPMTRIDRTNPIRPSLVTKITSVLGVSTLAVLIGLPALSLHRPQGETNLSRLPETTSEMAQNSSTSDQAVETLEREFILMAAQGNNAEIQTSQLALERSQSDTVRQYAQRMIDEHTAANEQLQPLAEQRGVELPTTPSSFDTAVLEQLAQVPDEQFDQAYMDTQVNAHLRSLGIYRTGARQVTDTALQNYASTLLPSIRDHLEIADAMVRGNSAQMHQQ